MTFLSCGLDTFYIIPSPSEINLLTISNDDPGNNKVSFRTNETGIASDFSFDGTYIYYRIFATKEACESSYTAIDAVNNDSNYETASNRIISSYKIIKFIDSGNNVDDYLIGYAGLNRNIEIRLTNYFLPDSPMAEYMSFIKIDGLSNYKPVRSESTSSNPKYFDFGWRSFSGYNDTCALPDKDSEDFDKGTSSDGYYYIDLYAIAIGHDTTIKTYRSRPLHLGVIKVNSKASNNWF
ncbi:MAG: hypothetical protein KBT21_06035 [Treponema sp.]|nr:hypothetical protein [Candidatus Treponema merdequi]